MILDIIIVAIILISAYVGKKTGFALTVINFTKWIAIIVLGIIFTRPIKAFLTDNTTMDEWLYKKLQETLLETSDFKYPEFFPENLTNINESIAGNMANSVVGVFMTLMSFLIVLLFIGLIAIILSAIFSKKHNKDNIIGATDGFVGLAFGLLRGILIVCIILAVMIPATGFIMPDKLEAVNKALSDSYIAIILYDNNPLLLFLNNYL
jgi:uncharacterized membrane protein required for colicin V production